jgi:hypothetical protein
VKARYSLFAVMICVSWLFTGCSEKDKPESVRVKPGIAVKRGSVEVSGSFDVELKGGSIAGAIKLSEIPYPKSALLRLQDGHEVGGTISANVVFKGKHSGGAIGLVNGTSQLDGSFALSDRGCTGKVSGAGIWTGDTDAAAGTMDVRAHWDDLLYEGCGVASHDEFNFRFPTLTFPSLLGRNAAYPRRLYLIGAVIGFCILLATMGIIIARCRKRAMLSQKSTPAKTDATVATPTIAMQKCPNPKCGRMFRADLNVCVACATRVDPQP